MCRYSLLSMSFVDHLRWNFRVFHSCSSFSYGILLPSVLLKRTCKLATDLDEMIHISKSQQTLFMFSGVCISSWSLSVLPKCKGRLSIIISFSDCCQSIPVSISDSSPPPTLSCFAFNFYQFNYIYTLCFAFSHQEALPHKQCYKTYFTIFHTYIFTYWTKI